MIFEQNKLAINLFILILSFNLNNQLDMSNNRNYSPSRERVAKISSQLSQMDLTIEGERTKRIEESETRLDQLESGLNELNEQLSQRVALIKDSVLKLQKVLDQTKLQREQHFEQKQKEYIDLENSFNQAVEGLTSTRKDGEQKIIRFIEEKTGLIRSELSTESRTRNENIERLNQCLETDLPRLHEAIKTEVAEREEMDSNISRKMNEELSKLNQLLVQEKVNRQESEQAIFDMLKDVVNRIKTEVDNEKKQRESTEETLLALLEDTCNKVNAAQLA
ncbi:unnamed protein product (macronuclear) [Paramecium tetraurelia]|uniref:Uncharacterized protein n=1 Tax=Paramecium tetraurelia TaxID=5888 RepID=A0CBL3_PARTE|nr:uncharacterized protein GSPATT00036963001 [Paramecium tetraurelia]CAK68180.1 unnamed protein product [Paramecium tetraurelia]|eukprot:XP_001435577.1 hypothetical protein (macronuclear) [Paramecium tetraurelia strain d4-2]